MEASRSISAAAPSCSSLFPNLYNKDCFLRLESGKSCILSHPSKDVLIRAPTAFCPSLEAFASHSFPQSLSFSPWLIFPFLNLPALVLPGLCLGSILPYLSCLNARLPASCNSLPSSFFLLVSICWTNFEWPAFERLDVPFESKHDQPLSEVPWVGDLFQSLGVFL